MIVNEITQGQKQRVVNIWMILWLILLIIGIIGIYQRLMYGHTLANYGSYVPWGLWVAAYIFFSGLSAGSFLISALFYGFGLEVLRPVARPALIIAGVSLLCGLIAISLDLGHMTRAYLVFLSPNFSSMMAWMVWLYAIYFVIVAIMLKARLTAQPGSPHHLKWLARFGIVLVFTFGGGVGALFATVSAREYWHNPLLPVMFLVGALLTASGLLLWISVFWRQQHKETENFLRNMLVVTIVLYVILEWAEFSVGLWSGIGHEIEILKLILFGKYWWVFWIAHLAIGVVLPLWILFKKNSSRVSVGMAGLIAAVFFFSVRLNIVIPGLVTPELKGIEYAYRDEKLTFTYFPSMHEWFVVAFIVSIGIGFVWLAFKRFLKPHLEIH